MGSVPLVLALAQWYTIYGPAARRKTDVNVESALIEAVRCSQAIVDMRAQPILNPRPQLGWILAQRGPANAAASRRGAVGCRDLGP